jgi:propionyl-CoA carboxylase alpha chain
VLTPAALDAIAAFAACAAYKLDARGFADANDNGLYQPSQQQAVLIGEGRWQFEIVEKHGEYWLQSATGKTLVEMNWGAGDSIARVRVDGQVYLLKVARQTAGFRIRYRGADLKVTTLLPHVADLIAHMPVKVPPDLSKFLLCPMPGQVVRIDVAEGDVVEDGQQLAIVEAMKMENVLKAEKRARVAKVHVIAGAVLAVDQVILEFAEV